MQLDQPKPGALRPHVYLCWAVPEQVNVARCFYLPLPPTWQGLTQGQWPEGRLKWRLGEVDVGHEPRLEPCWSMLLIDPLSAMWELMSQSDLGPKIWVQARMPGYSLNWTARSSAIQRSQRSQWCSSPTRRWSNRNRGSHGLKSAIDSFSGPRYESALASHQTGCALLYCALFWKNPGNRTLQNGSWTAAYLPSRKLSK